MKKRTYLKKEVEKVLQVIAMLIISFFAITIDSLGNSTYNGIALVFTIVLVCIGLLLNAFGRDFEEE
jgi:uncharacterized membrane protein YdbT with pleckstrin-like domain